MAASDPSLVPALLKEMLESMATGAMSPLPVTEFTDAKEAFRYMAQARHIGKIVVSQDGYSQHNGPLRLNPDATYLITGGWGALGLLFAEMLVERGARHLILIGRNAPSAIGREAIQRMRDRGADVKVRADVSDRDAMEGVFQSIPASKPIKGVLHAAGVLEDHSLLEQNPATLCKVMRPKWLGRVESAQTDESITSSTSLYCSLQPRHAGFARTNELCHFECNARRAGDYRRSLGLPALSIQWGPWRSAGMTEKLKKEPSDIGLGRIEPDEGFAALETLLTSEKPVATVLPVLSWKKLINTRPAGTSALFSMLVETDNRPPKGDREANHQDFCQVLLSAAAEERSAYASGTSAAANRADTVAPRSDQDRSG